MELTHIFPHYLTIVTLSHLDGFVQRPEWLLPQPFWLKTQHFIEGAGNIAPPYNSHFHASGATVTRFTA